MGLLRSKSPSAAINRSDSAKKFSNLSFELRLEFLKILLEDIKFYLRDDLWSVIRFASCWTFRSPIMVLGVFGASDLDDFDRIVLIEPEERIADEPRPTFKAAE